MPELVLYGIRLLAKQFLGTVLDIEVDHSAGYVSCKKRTLTGVFRMAFTAEQDIELISKLVRRAWRPLVFDKHFFLPDLARLGQQSVNMMNMVREPVARPEFSTLIGRGPTRLGSHWSRAS